MEATVISMSVKECKLLFTYFYFKILRLNTLELAKYSLAA